MRLPLPYDLPATLQPLVTRNQQFISDAVAGHPELDLQAWLTDPEALVPGQAMGYRLSEAADRRDVVALAGQIAFKRGRGNDGDRRRRPPATHRIGGGGKRPVEHQPLQVLPDEGTAGKAGKVEAAKHPGYAKTVLSYDKSTDTWTEAEEGSANVLSTGCTKWSGGYAVTNGELRPFVRSAEGWLLRTE